MYNMAGSRLWVAEKPLPISEPSELLVDFDDPLAAKQPN